MNTTNYNKTWKKIADHNSAQAAKHLGRLRSALERGDFQNAASETNLACTNANAASRVREATKPGVLAESIRKATGECIATADKCVAELCDFIEPILGSLTCS